MRQIKPLIIIGVSLLIITFAIGCGSGSNERDSQNSPLKNISLKFPIKNDFKELGKLLTGYQLTIFPDCQDGTKLDHIADWEDDEISQKIALGCDYMLRFYLGKKKSSEDNLSVVYLSTDVTEPDGYLLRKEVIEDNSDFSLYLKLGVTKDGEKAGFNYALLDESKKGLLTVRLNIETGQISLPITPEKPGSNKPLCVFAFGPIPTPKPDGSRGSTYSGHGSARDYGQVEGTKLFAMGECLRRWITEEGDDNCGNGIGTTCVLGAFTMIVTYCHMRDVPVSKTKYSMGEFLGYVGTTGNSTGPHLHLGLLNGDKTHVKNDNPDQWISEQDCYNDPRL